MGGGLDSLQGVLWEPPTHIKNFRKFIAICIFMKQLGNPL